VSQEGQGAVEVVAQAVDASADALQQGQEALARRRGLGLDLDGVVDQLQQAQGARAGLDPAGV
jgi:hypothetical protein